SFLKLMKQFPASPHVTETSAGPAMMTLLITSGELAGSRIAAFKTLTGEPLTGGFVTVTTPPVSGSPVNVLNAAILDPANSPEVINSVIIAGPADVSVTCGDAGNCFISFKKDSN